MAQPDIRPYTPDSAVTAEKPSALKKAARVWHLPFTIKSQSQPEVETFPTVTLPTEDPNYNRAVLRDSKLNPAERKESIYESFEDVLKELGPVRVRLSSSDRLDPLLNSSFSIREGATKWTGNQNVIAGNNCIESLRETQGDQVRIRLIKPAELGVYSSTPDGFQPTGIAANINGKSFYGAEAYDIVKDELGKLGKIRK